MAGVVGGTNLSGGKRKPGPWGNVRARGFGRNKENVRSDRGKKYIKLGSGGEGKGLP